MVIGSIAMFGVGSVSAGVVGGAIVGVICGFETERSPLVGGCVGFGFFVLTCSWGFAHIRAREHLRSIKNENVRMAKRNEFYYKYIAQP